MKRKSFGILTLAVCILLLPALLGGCVMVNFGRASIRGNGNIETRDLTPGAFSGISIGGGVELVYTQGDTCKLEIETDGNLFEKLRIDVRGNGLLTVNFDGAINPTRSIIYVTAPTLDTVNCAGAVDFNFSDTIRAQEFDLDISGACAGTLKVEATRIDAQISGACDMDMEGSCDDLRLSLSGAGKVNAKEFTAKDATLKISGAGEMRIACEDTLDATISGAGSVIYYGDPSVSPSISGAGSIRKG